METTQEQLDNANEWWVKLENYVNVYLKNKYYPLKSFTQLSINDIIEIYIGEHKKESGEYKYPLLNSLKEHLKNTPPDVLQKEFDEYFGAHILCSSEIAEQDKCWTDKDMEYFPKWIIEEGYEVCGREKFWVKHDTKKVYFTSKELLEMFKNKDK